MKLPEKPKNYNEIFRQHAPEISKLFNNKKAMDFIIKCNQPYIHWDQVRFKQTPDNISPEYLWVIMKLIRESQYKNFSFNSWLFRYILLDDFQKKLHILDKGTAGILGTQFESISPQVRERYIISSLMEEAIASSQLEGAATTRKVAKELLRKRKKPRNYSEQMIVNGYQTLQNILVSCKSKKITPDIILNLHKSITHDTLKDNSFEGKFRDNDEVIVGDPLEYEKVYYVPPNHSLVPELVEDLCKFANTDDGDFIHPIIKGILLHFLIAYIHPFEDGNGRTARALFYWYVLSRGYWLFEFIPISRILLRSKVNYGLSYLYTETDDNDLTYFIEFNLKAIQEAVEDMNTYIARKQKEQNEALQLIKNNKAINMRQAEILKQFIKNPEKIFDIQEIMTTYGVVYQTARSDLLHLAKLGYLEKTKIQKKYVFKFRENKQIQQLLKSI